MSVDGVKNADGMPEFVYDAVRYSNYPYAQTHPERLATVAILHGLTPPDPFSARVLEIGCGAGGNLLAMAAATPGIRALGVDLAASAIAEASAAVSEIGLGNVAFRQGDVRALTGGALGEFDYIVAHGVYSWVPEDARDALLATIHDALAPAGIAYVSFNAHPGGYFRRMLRDVGRWHARGADGELALAEKAQELFKFLKQHRVTTADPYGALLEREVPALADGPLYRLVHDDLGEFWHPLWFADFAAHAGRHGLGYVGEADLYGLRSEMLPEGVVPELWQLAGGDRIAFENLSDLMTGAPLPPEPVRPRRQAGRRRAGARAHRAAALGRAPVGRAARGRPGLRRLRRARRAPPADAVLRRAAGAPRRRSRRARRGAAGRLPPRAPDPARRAAGDRERARRAPAGSRRSRAGRRPAGPTSHRSSTPPCAWRSPPRGC